MPENETHEGKKNAARCGILFNVLLTILVMYFSFSSWLFDNVSTDTQNITDIIGKYGVKVELAVGLLSILALLVVGTIITKMIWNRLLVRLCHLDPIATGDAYCLFLSLTFLSEIF